MLKNKVTVVGLGYVGLPLAVLAKEKGWQVDGLEINEQKVAAINQGISPLTDDHTLAAALKKFRFTASADPQIVRDSAVIVIAVPTPVDQKNQPDLRPLKDALHSILPHLQSGQLLSVESTIDPGVMDEIVQPILETRPGLKLHLVHCPERVNPGDPTWSVRNIPRVLGGDTPASFEAGLKFYRSILEAPIHPMNSIKEAEAVKILENTFRDINIAFANEMARSFAKLEIDVVSVIKGAATKPFGFMPHYPGCGVGGHCISVDPYYMIERAAHLGFDHKFLKLARTINNSMPEYTVSLLEQALKKLGIKKSSHPQIALLGLAYKKNVADTRNSPAFTIRNILQEKKYSVKIFDPHVPGKSTVSSLSEALKGSLAIILATDHTELIPNLSAQQLKDAGIKIVVDGRNALDAEAIAQAGIVYYGIGKTRLPEKTS